MVTSIYCCAAVAFWSTFLVEQTDSCNSQSDCFLYSTTEESMSVSEENCTAYANSTYDMYINMIRMTFSAFNSLLGLLML